MENLKQAITGVILDNVARFLISVYKNRNIEVKRYSKEYVNIVRKCFYFFFALSLTCVFIPHSQYSFINIAVTILTVMFLFIALMQFMCLVEVVNYFADKNADNKESD